ncbi:COR domain-containing protein [Thiothrix unzii]|nr:COR domain-containing protein [Thiothrix unzii]
MADFPSKADIEKLYHEKGHDALVWYAWRNALRTVPFLGGMPIEKVWGTQAVRHVYAVCRSCLALAQWVDAPNLVAVAAAADIVATTTAYDRAKTKGSVTAITATAAASAAAATAATATTAIAYVVTDTGAYARAASATTSDLYTYAYADTDAYTRARVTAASATSAIATAAVTDAADADYKLLLQQNGLTASWWCSQPLWPRKWLGMGGGEPAEVMRWRQTLDAELRQLDLDFLADDLNALWESRPLEPHAMNYLKEYSDAELNDPAALRRLILGGDKEAEHIHAVRVLLLGPGGAGKSSLADRLQGKPVEQGKKPTVGVDYLNHQPLNLYGTFDYLQQGEKPLDLYLWDFGGQTIFHGLHSAFLHENCVYVLVVDSRHEQAPDEWLHQIRHLAGKQAKVLLVTNWYETCETHQNEARLLREFPDLLDKGFFYFSCHDPKASGLQDFVQILEQVCLDSQRMVLKETLDVNEALQQQYQDDVFLESVDLDEIIEQVTGRPDAAEILTNKLDQLGFLVRVDSDDQHYCLKPAWAVDHAYAVLYSPLLREAKGVLKLKDLQREFKDKIKAQHITYLVKFLQKRSLCRKLETGDGYFFPDAARANEQPEASKLLTDDQGLVIRFDLPYLPLGFHARLVHKLFNPHTEVGIRQTDDIWRQGFILRTRNAQAVVQYLLRKGSIEMVLVGELRNFADLLGAFIRSLKDVVVSPNGIRLEHIQPFVSGETQQLLSVHSGEELVKVLGQINSYDQLFQKVREMAGKEVHHHHGDTFNMDGGDGSNFAPKSQNFAQTTNVNKPTFTVTADQRQIISSVLDEMLRHKANLSDDVLEAVYDVRKAVKADEKQPTEKSQSVLGKLWSGIHELTNVAKDMTDVGGFVVEHQAAIGTAVTAAAALLS